MTHQFPAAAQSGSVLVRIIQRVIAAMGCIPYWFIALAARIFPAAVFWQSGATKVAGWHLKPSAIALFENEYQLPLIDPTIAAYVSAFSEHIFPILLVIGLATRFSALALLCMTAVIETFVYPGAWPTHGVWAACFLVVIARGPGSLSLDHLIARKFK
jgi:putative oxidoreductase